MENDDLFEIIEPAENENNTETASASNDATESNSEGELVQDESFVNSLDFVNGFSDIEEKGEAVIKDDSTNTNDDIMVDVEGLNSSIDEQEQIDNGESSEYISDDDFEINDEDLDEIEDDDYEQTMVITEGTTITGSITTDCSLDVYGTVNGDIFCDGKLSVSGKVMGNSQASEVMVNAHRVEGNITCEGVVKIGQGSVIIGDITAGAAVIAGAVKGTLDVKGPVILDSTAVIKGNIKAMSVQLINGAVLEGFCSLEYANSNVDDIFN